MYEWRFIRRQNGSVYSESSICRQYALWFKLRILCKAMRSTFTDFTSAVEASIKGYATRKLRCIGWAAVTGGGRPTFTSYQSAARSKTFFFLCWVHYALEGSTLSLSRCDFSSLFHTERSWHTYRFPAPPPKPGKSTLGTRLQWKVTESNLRLLSGHPH